MVTGVVVLSRSCSGSTLCHFILHLKLIVFLQPETLDYTPNYFSSLLHGTVLSDLTLSALIQNEICFKTQSFKVIISEVMVLWNNVS